MGWGLDAHWSAVARERGWRIGVVDATPIGHTIRPAAADYPRETAVAEARRFLAGRPYVTRDAVRTVAAHRLGCTDVKVLVVAEFYPRAADPVLGVWAHRQALAARDAGAEVRVLVLHRPIAPAARFAGPAARGASCCAQPRRDDARRPRRPLRPLRLAAARALLRLLGRVGRARRWRVALRRIRRAFPYRPGPRPQRGAGRRRRPAHARAARRWSSPCTAATSSTPRACPRGRERVRRAFSRRARRARQLAGHRGRLPRPRRARDARGPPRHRPDAEERRPPARPDARHRRPPHRPQAPGRRPARDVGPARPPPGPALPPHRRRPRARPPRAAGRASSGSPTASSSPASSRTRRRCARGRDASVFVMPSTDEAFGVAYVEAMAAGLPAIGARGEPGPEDIARLGHGMRLVPPGDVEALAAEIDHLLDHRLGRADRRRPRRRRSRRTSPGTRAARRPSRPTRRRWRGDAPPTAGPSCSSPTTSRPTARARSRRCTSARTSSWRLFGGRSHHATGGVDDPGVPSPPIAQREAYALAASGRYRAVIAGTAGRDRAARRRPRAPAARASRSCCGPRCGRTRARPPSPGGRAAAARHLPERRRGRHLRPARQRVRRRRAARATSTSRRRRSTTRSGARPRRRRTARAARPIAFAALASGAPRATRASRSCWRPGARPALGPPARGAHARRGTGPGRPALPPGVTPRRPPRSRRPAQLLRRRRRPGHVRHPDPRLPRAVGPGGQRSHEPTTARHRHHRRRRRRRRPRPPRAQRPRRPRRRRRRPGRRAAHARTTTPRCASGSARRRPRTSPPTRSPRGPPASPPPW